MKSVRTELSIHSKDLFRIFLDSIGLEQIMIGDYRETSNTGYIKHCICYAYSENSADIVAILTYISLKYGDLHRAFNRYLADIDSSPMYNPAFVWVP